MIINDEMQFYVWFKTNTDFWDSDSYYNTKYYKSLFIIFVAYGEHFKKGYVLTIVYGYPSFELYSDYREFGTLMCYNKHKTNNHPYSFIGAQDITSHVNFSALCLWGYKNGLEYSGFTDQSRFLSALGFREQIKKNAIPGQDYLNFKNEMLLTQTLIKEMGTKFKVLIQQKDTPNHKLIGLA